MTEKEAESLTDTLYLNRLDTKKRSRLCEATLSIEAAVEFVQSQLSAACFSHHVSF